MLPHKLLQEEKDGQPDWFTKPQTQTLKWLSAPGRGPDRRRQGKRQQAPQAGTQDIWLAKYMATPRRFQPELMGIVIVSLSVQVLSGVSVMMTRPFSPTSNPT